MTDFELTWLVTGCVWVPFFVLCWILGREWGDE
jgi:hypothetical protein